MCTWICIYLYTYIYKNLWIRLCILLYMSQCTCAGSTGETKRCCIGEVCTTMRTNKFSDTAYRRATPVQKRLMLQEIPGVGELNQSHLSRVLHHAHPWRPWGPKGRCQAINNNDNTIYITIINSTSRCNILITTAQLYLNPKLNNFCTPLNCNIWSSETCLKLVAIY